MSCAKCFLFFVGFLLFWNKCDKEKHWTNNKHQTSFAMKRMKTLCKASGANKNCKAIYTPKTNNKLRGDHCQHERSNPMAFQLDNTYYRNINVRINHFKWYYKNINVRTIHFLNDIYMAQMMVGKQWVKIEACTNEQVNHAHRWEN